MATVGGKNLAEYLVERWRAEDADPGSREKFDPLTCQCCGHKKHKESEPDCICAGQPWRMFDDGHLRCTSHMAMDEIRGQKRHWWSR